MHAASLLILVASLLPSIDTVVIVPPDLRQALAPWVAYRTAQGHDCRLLDARAPAEVLRGAIIELARHEPIEAVVLIGDCSLFDRDDQERRWTTPSFRQPARVNVRFGSTDHLGTDEPYGDLDGDGLAELAVGRLPADSPAELSAMIEKIRKFEQRAATDSRRSRVHFIAGTSGFGFLADAAIERVARSILCDHIPSSITTTMTYARPDSPYCPPPENFQSETIARFNDGGLFWVYLGHGQVRGVELCRAPGGGPTLFEPAVVPQMQASSGTPIAVLLACYAGAFDARVDCLAEELVKAPGGPVAVLAGSRVTMPYGMSVLGLELLEAYFHSPTATLGEWVRVAKRRSLERPRDEPLSQTLDMTARLLNPLATDLSAERAEHVLLFNLLGDPWLRCPRPARVTLDSLAAADPGEWLTVTGVSPVGGEAVVELVARRDRLTFDPAVKSGSDEQTQQANCYARANEPRWTFQRRHFEPGRFQVDLQIPEQVSGPCHVRVVVHGSEEFALGSTDVEIRPRTARAPNRFEEAR